MSFFEYYLQILLFTAAVPLGFGLIVWLCNRLFGALVGTGLGRPVLLGLHAVITPLREFAHLVAAFVTFHRIGDFCLLNLHDPEGELGFVEHSYNRKNPIAVFGNYLFAIFPAALGVLLSVLVVTVCFHGAFSDLASGVAGLVESNAGVGAYAELAFGFLPAMFRDSTSGIFAKIVGALLLLLTSLGIYVSLDDLKSATTGMFYYCVVALAFAGVTTLFDSRAKNLILLAFRTFNTGVVAIFTVILVFALAALVLGFLVFLVRTFLFDEKKAVRRYEEDEVER